MPAVVTGGLTEQRASLNSPHIGIFWSVEQNCLAIIHDILIKAARFIYVLWFNQFSISYSVSLAGSLALSSSWKRIKTWWSSFLDLSLFGTIFCITLFSGLRCQAIICVQWNVFLPSSVASKTSILSQENCMSLSASMLSGIYTYPLATYLSKTLFAMALLNLRIISIPIVWLAAWKSRTSFSDLVAWCKAKPSPICFGVNVLWCYTP